MLRAWSKATGAKGHIDFLADGSAISPRRSGSNSTFRKGGMGLRSKRYSMLVETAW